MAVEFNPTEEYILEDDRALLRPLKLDDYENLLPFALNESELWKYSLITAAGEEGLANYLDIALEGRITGKEYPFIVFDKLKNEYAGSTRFYDISPAFKSLQLGYTWYGKKFQRTGLNRHCKLLLLSFAFEEFGMERVEFRADNRNERSIAAMKAIGCKVEGVLRSHMPTRDPNVRRDSIILSILKDEWFGDVKEKLAGKLK
jgi:RimJ/RimL family protein N-acetyltransferase